MFSKRNLNCKLLIDFGKRPITNRFLKKSNDKKALFNLKLVQDQETGLVKLMKPLPYKELIPHYNWITYSEPEKHLNEMVRDIIKSSQISNKQMNVGGITFKDDTTLNLFKRKGHNTWRLKLREDLGLQLKCGVESIQKSIEYLNTNKIIKKYGKADVLIVRHIWEHVYNQEKFIKSLKKILKKDAIMLLEIPDCSKLIKNCDYTMIWEEHLFYYTPKTFFESLNNKKLSILFAKQIIYAYEDVLYAIVKPSKKISNNIKIPINTLKREIINAENYSKKFVIIKHKIQNFLLKRKKKGKIALFGVGHFSVSFVSILDIKDVIDMAIDDNPNKIGKYMPVGNIPILSSKALYNNDINICLLTLNPQKHKIILKKHKKFIDKGGVFYSIFPGIESKVSSII